METDPTYPIDLITCYLAGEASGDDLVFLEAWLKADPGNRKVFEDYRRIWFSMEQARLENSLELNTAWKEMEEIMNEKPASQIPHLTFQIHYRQVFRIAAILLFL